MLFIHNKLDNFVSLRITTMQKLVEMLIIDKNWKLLLD